MEKPLQKKGAETPVIHVMSNRMLIKRWSDLINSMTQSKALLVFYNILVRMFNAYTAAKSIWMLGLVRWTVGLGSSI